MECRLVSSLVKVFPDHEPKGKTLRKASALKGEVYSFQAIYKSPIPLYTLRCEVTGPLADCITARRVGNVYVENMGYDAIHDGTTSDSYLRSMVYPDVLYTDDLLHAARCVWYSVWITVRVPKNCKAGKYDFRIQLRNEVAGQTQDPMPKPMKFTLTVVDAVLPEQTLRHTEWFYCDCICHQHHVQPWSPKMWKLLQSYFKNFTAHGINMLLTPVFTPSLDTVVGGERLTTQLVGIKKNGRQYEFDFRKFERWVRLAQKCGVKYFEIAHFFTQWGAKCTPKIMADVKGKEVRIFGWDVASDSKKYRDFLDAFLPALKQEIISLGIQDCVYFHISDEPNLNGLKTYTKASRILRKHLDGWKILDAASEPEFYTKGLVKLPVPCESVLEKFMNLNIPERWTYYCGGPGLPYSNRIHAMPATANRIMGVLLYLYRCDGFLHWGYNFWNSLLSRRSANPLTMNADWDYPGGDQCLVYPGENEPLDSIRGEVFAAGLQDMRALQKLESLKGRDYTVRLIHKTAGMTVTMGTFPLEEDFLLNLREKVNHALSSGK